MQFQKMCIAALVTANLAVTGTMNAQANQIQVQTPKANVSVGTNGANVRVFNGINRDPWFGNAAIREHLQLNDNQYRQLGDNYGRAYLNYNQSINGLDKNLSDQERMQRTQDFNNRFHQDFSGSNNAVFSDSNASQRYNQLYLQYRGYGAFNDPSVQKQLNLTEAQRRQFSNYDRDWNRQMNTWSRDYSTDPDRVNQNFNQSRVQFQQNVNSTLTPEQQQSWNALRGQQFDFKPDVYFQGNTVTTSKPVLK